MMRRPFAAATPAETSRNGSSAFSCGASKSQTGIMGWCHLPSPSLILLKKYSAHLTAVSKYLTSLVQLYVCANPMIDHACPLLHVDSSLQPWFVIFACGWPVLGSKFTRW